MLQQPKGFYLLCFTEMWERFGFYTLQTIIILYMSAGLHFSDKQAYLLYGSFSSMLYLTPVLGGLLADRYLGFQRTIILGGIFLMIGYVLCAFPSYDFFMAGLTFIVVGNGLLKPNISSIVGLLYERDDPRREGGFTLFYMAINLGSLIPPIFAGTLVTRYGWHSGFLTAACGMCVGILLFVYLRKHLEGIGSVGQDSPLYNISSHINKTNIMIAVGLVVSVILICTTLYFDKASLALFIIFAVFYFIFVIGCALKEPARERNNIFSALLLILISVGFWTLYNQTFTSLMLFAKRNMNHHFLGLTIDAEFTQFFNPFFILVLGPVLSGLWVRLSKYKLNPSIPKKFFLATLFMMLGFMVLSVACSYMGDDNSLVSPFWLIVSYLLQTIGELLISPIGLSMITLLIPEKLSGTMMGMWFLSLAASFSLSGLLATFSNVPEAASVGESLNIYSHAFSVYFVICIVLCFVALLLVRPIQRLISSSNN